MFKAELITGDFSDNTMTFEIKGEMTLKAGEYVIFTKEEFEKPKRKPDENGGLDLTCEELEEFEKINPSPEEEGLTVHGIEEITINRGDVLVWYSCCNESCEDECVGGCRFPEIITNIKAIEWILQKFDISGV